MITPNKPRIEFNYYPWDQRHLPESERGFYKLQEASAEDQKDAENASSHNEIKGTVARSVQTPGDSKFITLCRCLKGWGGKGWDGTAFRAGNDAEVLKSLDYVPQHHRDEMHAYLTRNERYIKVIAEAAREKHGVKLEDWPEAEWAV